MKCAHCGREVKNPHHILGLVLGSECVERYAGLEGMLQAAGITFPQEFPMVATGTDSFGSSLEFKALVFKAAAMGVRLKIETTWGVQPVDTVVGIRSADPSRIPSYSEVRSSFATQLQAAQP
jgi:hypothetical protein